MKVTQADIEKVMQLEPRLTPEGITPTPSASDDEVLRILNQPRPSNPADLLGMVEQVQICCDWLQQQKRVGVDDVNSHWSYGLAWELSLSLNRHISNGAMIAACILLGIEYKYKRTTDDSVVCGISRRVRTFSYADMRKLTQLREQAVNDPMRK
jgi:hypothetical protein